MFLLKTFSKFCEFTPYKVFIRMDLFLFIVDCAHALQKYRVYEPVRRFLILVKQSANQNDNVWNQRIYPTFFLLIDMKA